jgi:peptidoglycan/LPS O-acetylase OafA/YrhL
VPEVLDPVQAALQRDEAGDRSREGSRSARLDALRALAAMMVLLAHASFIANDGHAGPVGTALRQMLGAGVLIFFSLSGYLIAGPFLRALVTGDALPRTAPYLVRRAARIYPAYWLAFAAVLILLWPAGGVEPYQVPVHVLLLQSSWPAVGEPSAIFFVAWTLGVEVAFYALVPLAAALLRRLHPRPWRPERLALVVLGAGVASLAWTYFVNVHVGNATSRPALVARIGLQTWLFTFAPGMLVALLAMAPSHPLRRLFARPALTLPLVVALWGAAYALERSGSAWVHNTEQLAYVLASGALLGTVVAAGPWIRPFARVLAPLGLVSYGIYLWHDIVVEVIRRHPSAGVHGGAGAWLADIAIVTAITVPIATASWLAIERPSIHWAAAWARRRRAVPQAAAARLGQEPT